jgi:Flp pilus assembly CpaE family ATPase
MTQPIRPTVFEKDPRMTASTRSVLVISPDDSISRSVGTALLAHAQVKVDTRTATLSGLNGKAALIAGGYDMVIFQTRPDDAGEIAAIETLSRSRGDDLLLVALADGNITLQQVRDLNRAGVADVLPIPVASRDLGAQIARLDRAGQTAAPGAALGRVIAVTQARGGAGSTTVAVNLADQLAAPRGRGRRARQDRVALVDMDLQYGTVGSYLDLPEQDALLQLAQSGAVPDATFLDQATARTSRGVQVLPAPSRFAPLDSLRSDQVAAIIDGLRATNDYVIVDLPRALVGWIEPIVQRADELIIVTDIAVSSVRQCRRLIDFFTADHLSLPVSVVVNRARKPFLPSRLQREAERVLQRPVDQWLPPDARAAAAAADRGEPLATVSPRGSLSRAMSRMAQSTRIAFPPAASSTEVRK